MDSTMQHVQLGVAGIFEHGRLVHPHSRVVHYRGDEAMVDRTFADFAGDAVRLANALGDIGIGAGDVVATLAWNTPAHLAAYLAVPSVGAVLHTLNLRLHDDQLAYIIEQAGDRAVLVDGSLAGQLERILPRTPGVRDVIIDGGATFIAPDGVRVHRYTDLLTAAAATITWPEVDERSTAALCYTSGTTGNPKGVAYSHRSIHLHTLQVSTGSAFGFSDADRILPIVPMFHANAWGWPHAAWLAGADIVLNDRYLQADHLARIISDVRPSAAAAVPTVWSGLADVAESRPVDYSSLRLAVSGGSPLSVDLIERMRRHGVTLYQGWGMTETSPLLTFSRPEPDTAAADIPERLAMTGHLIPGVQVRLMDLDRRGALPWDGESIGEIQLRGNTITGAYLGGHGAEAFDGGWLRTGDLGVIHPGGWVHIKDRLKDGIKSGGEWISTMELEAQLLRHPGVAEAAVFGVPDAKWEERPLVCVTLRPGIAVTAGELRAFLSDRVARWWVPERWAFLPELPKTTVGKLDKRRLRTEFGDGTLTVHTVDH
ncbi:medium chain fatty-acid-CoA ligase FadD14_1 [Mycobacteroides abscessus subsp. abscessus]|nr:medium chain fatty-acid-CoA ligase FadD14_1 [Mycobacteroides abscessus subsp. abscessus]